MCACIYFLLSNCTVLCLYIIIILQFFTLICAPVAHRARSLVLSRVSFRLQIGSAVPLVRLVTLHIGTVVRLFFTPWRHTSGRLYRVRTYRRSVAAACSLIRVARYLEILPRYHTIMSGKRLLKNVLAQTGSLNKVSFEHQKMLEVYV